MITMVARDAPSISRACNISEVDYYIGYAPYRIVNHAHGSSILCVRVYNSI